MNGIRPIETPEGRKFELHWNGKVTTYDDRPTADKALVEKIAEDAGRSPSEETKQSPVPSA